MTANQNVSVLIVDDRADKRLALETVLADLGLTIVSADSGRQALKHLLSRDFAAILLDVDMPGMDGFETAALIRQRQNSEHTPIIFVTAYGDDMYVTRGYSLGAVDYILTPIVPAVLRTKVAVFIELYKKNLEIRGQAQRLEERAAQLNALNQASLAINSALSMDAMMRLAVDRARELAGAARAVLRVATDQHRNHTREVSSPAENPESVADSALFHELTVPLMGRDAREIGSLWLAGPDENFTENDRALVTQLAQIASVAIENTLFAEAREANRLKDEFLATLSHELRTPLTAMLGWTQLLRAGSLDGSEAPHALEVIERNVMSQIKLIDDLLDVSRITSGKLRLKARPIELAPVVQAATEVIRPVADEKQVSIELWPAASLAPVSGDPDRLQQVVWNLLANAVKFTPSGGRVKVSMHNADAGVEISVTDTGIGIHPSFLPHIFERFRQADSTSTRSHGGLGIGLALVRHVVELHGGRVEAHSAGEGQGATIRVWLPEICAHASLDPVDSRNQRPAVSRAATVSLNGLQILVVDDDADAREVLGKSLVQHGASAHIARSCEEALEHMRDRPIDVLVSDIGMPEKDGYALIRAVRALPQGRGGAVPAVAVTAFAREDDRQRALTAGFQAHVCKPVEPAHLAAVIVELAQQRLEELGRSVGAKPDGNGRPGAPLLRGDAPHRQSPQGPASLNVLVAEDTPANQKLIVHILGGRGHHLVTVDNGRQAVAAYRQQTFDVALFDLVMPELDGYAATHEIREHERASGGHMPIVALTAHALDDVLPKCQAAGMDGCLAKPLDAAELIQTIERLAAGELHPAASP